METITQTKPAESSTHVERSVAAPIARRSAGFTRLISVTGILMSLALPIGIVPRVMQSHELDAAHTKVVDQTPLVSVTHPQVAPPQRKLSLPGTIEAIVESPIYGRTNGYIQERYVDIGDKVKAGQLLARIETPEVDQTEKESKAQVLTNEATKAQTEANLERAHADLARAVADLAEAQAFVVEHQKDLKFAKSTTARWDVLAAEGAVSAQDAEEKETRYQTSQASIDAAREHVNSANSAVAAAKARLKAEEANVKVASSNLEAAKAHAERSGTERGFQKVTSPFNGVITERNVDQGTLVTSGSENSKLPMYRLARIDTVKVFVDVPQFASSDVRVGQDVDVQLKEFPDKKFVGKVARTAVALDEKARTLRVEIHIPNANLALAPGMYADVVFAMNRGSKMVLIPANSLISRAEGPQVATLNAGHNISYKQVKLGQDLGSQIEVLGGLSGSDTVVVNPADTLTEGMAVAIAK